MEDSQNKRPIDIIRKMNPGVSIPSGQELADFLNEKETGSEKVEIEICPRCGDPLFGGECILCD